MRGSFALPLCLATVLKLTYDAWRVTARIVERPALAAVARAVAV